MTRESAKPEERLRLQRRSFLKGAAGAVVGLPLISRAAPARPNIILITADDLGSYELNCYGNSDVHSPSLDRLAGEGVHFTNAFVTAASCSPSRASIMTGQAPHSVGVLGLTHRHPRYQMPSDVPTLARALQESGYRTAIEGKWHVATYKNTRSYGYQSRLGPLAINDSAKAKKYISENREKRFFLELNFIQPHRLSDGTFKMDPDFAVDPESISVPDYWQLPDWPELRQDAAAYYSQIARMDHIIGEILDHLDATGLAQNTLVAFVSDNGAPYPGCKTTCYDRGIKTPLIVRWPEALPAGETSDALVSTIDLMPTCLDAAGMSAPPPVQGRSLLPLIRGEGDAVHDAIFAEITYHVIYTPMRAIRTREWKYIENLSPDPTGLDQNKRFEWAQRAAREPGQRCCALRPPEELFNLDEDPHEQKNRADDPNAARIKVELKNRLDEWRKQTRDPFPDLD